MLPLARIRENVRAALGVRFKVTVGTDGDVADLGADFFDNMIYQALLCHCTNPLSTPPIRLPCPPANISAKIFILVFLCEAEYGVWFKMLCLLDNFQGFRPSRTYFMI